VDETGHSGGAGAAEGGNGADARERNRVNGWATPDSPWARSGAALDSEEDVPAWRRPSTETRLFPRSPTFPSSGLPAAPAPAPQPPGFLDAPRAGENPSSGESYGAQRWADSRTRYSDLLSPLTEPTGPQQRVPGLGPSGTPREPGLGTGGMPTAGAAPAAPAIPATREPGSGTGSVRELRPGRPTSLRGYDVPTPNSAPPFPYEGDLDDPRDATSSAAQQRAAVPLVRPATPAGGRRADWSHPDAEPARHALSPSATTQSVPKAEPTEETRLARPSYDPSSFPRRLSYEPTPAAESSGYVPPAAYAAFNRGAGASDPRPADPGTRVLPQRVPAQPDVPRVPEPPLVEPTAETPALARIATHLRRGDVLPAQERQEGFDVQAILAAVREVDGVRDASLRQAPTGAHSLRLDLAEGADPAEVSRQVARLLSERMGLDAAMQGEAPAVPPAAPPASAPASPAAAPPSAQMPPTQAPSAQLPPTSIPSARPATPVSAPPVPAPASAPPAAPPARSAAPADDPLTGPLPVLADDPLTRPFPAAPAAAAQPSAPPAPKPVFPAPSSAPPAPKPDFAAPPAPKPDFAAPPAPKPDFAAPPASKPDFAAPPTPAPDPPKPKPLFAAPPAASPASAPPAPVAVAPAAAPTRTDRPEQRERAGQAAPAAESRAVEPTDLDYRQPRPIYPGEHPGPRIVIENVHVNTFGTEATVSVRLSVGSRTASGEARGPAFDGYLLRLCAMATAGAVDQLLSASDHPDGPARCFIEHAAAVPFGASQVAVVVLLLSWGGWVEQLAGSVVVTGDDRHAMVRATLAAVNRRLEALLSR